MQIVNRLEKQFRCMWLSLLAERRTAVPKDDGHLYLPPMAFQAPEGQAADVQPTPSLET